MDNKIVGLEDKVRNLQEFKIVKESEEKELKTKIKKAEKKLKQAREREARVEIRKMKMKIKQLKLMSLKKILPYQFRSSPKESQTCQLPLPSALKHQKLLKQSLMLKKLVI